MVGFNPCYIAIASGVPCKGVFFGRSDSRSRACSTSIEWVNTQTNSLDEAVSFVIDYCRDNNIPCGVHTPTIPTRSRQRFYGVARGWATGVVLSYEDCLLATSRCMGRRFKGFATATEAIQWVRAQGGPFCYPIQGSVGAIAASVVSPNTPVREGEPVSRPNSPSPASNIIINIENLYITAPPSRGANPSPAP